MWISKITRSKNLMWFYLTQQLHRLLNVVFKRNFFRELASIIERQILEVDIFVWQTNKTCSGNRLTFTNQGFDNTDNFRINLIWLFCLEKFSRLIIDLACSAIIIFNSNSEVLHKLQITQNIIIPYRCISRSLVCYVYIVSLIGQTDKRTTHRNHVIIRVW